MKAGRAGYKLKRKDIGGGGSSTHSESLNPYMNKVLWKIALRCDVDRSEKPKKVRKDAIRLKNVKFSDEQVLDMRRKYEFEGMKPAEIQKIYQCDIKWLYGVLSYKTRSKLVPTKDGGYYV